MAPLTRPSFKRTSSATSSSTNRPIVNIRRKRPSFSSIRARHAPRLDERQCTTKRRTEGGLGQLWRNSLLDHRRRAYTGGWTGDSTTPQAPAPTPMALLAVLTRPPSGLTGWRFAFDDHRRRRRAAAIRPAVDASRPPT